PNGAGIWRQDLETCAVHLGHTRLAVQDLSEAAQQPFVSSNGRQLLIFNGEVYNFLELRRELESKGISFRSAGDTEVVFRSLLQDGEKAITKFNGMWSFAWLDLDRRILLLSRDRVGQKPLYYHFHKGTFYFASEIKGIIAGRGDRFRPNLEVIARHLHQSLLDVGSETFFDGVFSLPGGCNAVLDLSGGKPNLQIARYWNLTQNPCPRTTASECAGQLKELFIDSVRLQLRSDVPVGVMISGGVGSSSIATAMRQVLGKDVPIAAFAAISDESEFSEETQVDTIANFLGFTPVKLNWRPNGAQAFGILEELTYFNDEPIGDFSSVYHHLLMREAREHGVTVILSGNGDDEMFYGYKKYLGFYLQSLLRAGRVAQASRVAFQFWKNGTVFSQFRWNEAKRYLPAFLRPPKRDILGARLRGYIKDQRLGLGNQSLVDRQCEDIFHLSMPTQLHYEDRMSMACSREVRLPFLDHRLIELAVSLAPDLKLRDGWNKWIWRKAMEDLLPPETTWRKDKQGFVNPQSHWLRRNFSKFLREMLHGDLLIEQYDLVKRQPLQQMYSRYCHQSNNHGDISYRDILDPIALELWLRVFKSHLSFS
ncbi:MAG: asparagine synthase (glutamine-hydrolyzing), partial [Alphaproteobacteria bacterium]|nr:asparagine synthase (glutamine-hydrolyzing) [Alphaproteobacteria bacterium]